MHILKSDEFLSLDTYIFVFISFFCVLFRFEGLMLVVAV